MPIQGQYAQEIQVAPFPDEGAWKNSLFGFCNVNWWKIPASVATINFREFDFFA